MHNVINTKSNTANKLIKAACCLTALTLSSGLLTTAQADYPAGDEITVLQGFKPGGGSDIVAQLTQPFLSETLNVDFINQYVPGATGAIAWTRLAKQSPNDGTVLSVTNTPMIATNYIMNDAIQYNIDEFTPIANVVSDPGIIVVSPDSPYQTVEEFFAAARENPGQITVGNSGVGGDDYFTSLIIEKATGLEFKKVPFQGDGPSSTAAMGGKIDASFNNVGTVYGQIKAGNLRPLAVFSEERLDMLPDVPTLREKDINVVAGSSRGYSAPKGIPEEARQELIAAFETMAQNPEFQKKAQQQALNINIVTGDDYADMLARMEKEYKEVWSEVKGQVNQ